MENKIKTAEEILKNKFANHTFENLTANEEEMMLEAMKEYHSQFNQTSTDEKEMDEFAVGFNAFVITNYIKKYEGYILRMGSIDAKPKSITELLTTYKESQLKNKG